MSDKRPYGFSKVKSRIIHDRNFGPHQGVGSDSRPPEQRRVAIAITDNSVVEPINGSNEPEDTTITIYGTDGTNAIESQVTQAAINANDVCLKPARLVVAIREYVGGAWVPLPTYGRKFIVKTGGSGIDAISTANVPGTAIVYICKDDGTNGLITVATALGKNIDYDAIPANKFTWGAEEDRTGVLVVSQLPITDLQLDGNDYQYFRGGDWVTWVTGSDCPETT